MTVGGTFQIDPEVAANFSAGGGFSKHISRPAYRNGHVSAYLHSISCMYSELYNYAMYFDNWRLQSAHGHVAIRDVGTQICPPKRWASNLKSYSAVLTSLLVVQAA